MHKPSSAKANFVNALCLTAVICTAASPASDAAAPSVVETPHVTARLVADQHGYVSGQPLSVGLHFALIPGWHVYWRNPGDSGEPPYVDWQLPEGVEVGEIAWPMPERIDVGPLRNYGYEESVLFAAPLDPGDRTGPLTIRLEAAWLVCEELCIPEEGTFTLTLPPAMASSPGPDAPLFGQARADTPIASPWPVRYRSTDGGIELELELAAATAARINDAYFFPHEYGVVRHAGEQPWRNTPSGLRLTLPSGELGLASASPLVGVLVVEEDTADGPRRLAFTVDASEVSSASPPTGPALGLLIAILFALAGGLILNLMPCVLPIIAVKALGFVELAGADAARVRVHGLAYAGGVISGFLLLAIALISLRAAGAAVGWGFQLQSPLVAALLGLLMFGFGLSLSGLFDVGNSIVGWAGGVRDPGGATGSVLTGLLAVALATPCTAPFMGAALGFALTQPWTTALAVFAALGLGMAAPYVVLSLRPAWANRLPKPGPWMQTLRQALAFPLYATAVWLVWVVARQAGADAAAGTLGAGVLLAFAVWLGSRLDKRLVEPIGAVCAVGVVLLATTRLSVNPVAETVNGWESWSPARVAALRAEGRPVLVNFTADWCITCKVNERIALSTAAVRASLAAHDVALLEGDWTRRDAAIAGALAEFGRSGVPLVVLYPVVGDPEVLPAVLTEKRVLAAVEKTVVRAALAY
ncbi:MAG: protein-disulfide reductase DsbD domain-containing protein [Pseudomonadota bacterium]